MADINLHLSAAEEACQEQEFSVARSELDKAEISLDELRAYWPDLVGDEKGLLAAMAKPLSVKHKKVSSMIPKSIASVIPKDDEARLETDDESEVPEEETEEVSGNN